MGEPGCERPVPEVVLFFDVGAGEHHGGVGSEDEEERDERAVEVGRYCENGRRKNRHEEGEHSEAEAQENAWNVVVAGHAA